MAFVPSQKQTAQALWYQDTARKSDCRLSKSKPATCRSNGCASHLSDHLVT
jgi:hypothetical protein